MKRVLAAVVLVAIMLAVSGCESKQAESAKVRVSYAQIMMPDGTVINGVCTYYSRLNNTVWLTIDGIEYVTHLSRVVRWDESK